MKERLEQLRRFQKCLRRATEASTPGEAEAAEAAARRIMQAYGIDPVKLTDKSLYDRTTFEDNMLLKALREEYYEARQRERKQRRVDLKNQKISPALREKIRAALRGGAAPIEVQRRFGLTRGQIAGIKWRMSPKTERGSP